MLSKEEKAKLPYTVFARYDNGTFVVRFTIKGHPQTRIGLGTRDEAEAYELAAKKYMEIQIRAEHGLLTGVASFDKLAREYVGQQFLEAEKNPKRLVHAKHARSTVENYLIPHFKRTPITAIFHNQLMEYLDWRKVFWTTGEGKDKAFVEHKRSGRILRMPVRHIEASPSTLKRESSFLRGVFKHAVRKGFLKQSDVPKLELGRVPTNKRPSFTKREYGKLLQVSEQRLLAVQSHPKLLYERYLLHNFIVIAAETGMRPMEMFNLNWGHIDGLKEALKAPVGERAITIIAYSKGKRPQRFVPRRSAISGFENLWHGYNKQFGRFPADNDPVFCNYAGARIGSFNKSLNALLEAADLKYDAVGNKFSTYSFRHSYATWQLQKSPPVDIYTLAINMRTSVEMIEKWYSDVIPEDRASILRGDDEW